MLRSILRPPAGCFGSAVVSANQIALGLASFTFMGALGVTGATAVRVGHAVGARDRESARLAGLTGIGMGAAAMCLGAVAFATAPRILVGFFTDDPEIVTLGTSLVRVAAVFQLFDGMQAVGAGALRGAGDVRFAFFGVGLVSYWGVGLPLRDALWHRHVAGCGGNVVGPFCLGARDRGAPCSSSASCRFTTDPGTG